MKRNAGSGDGHATGGRHRVTTGKRAGRLTTRVGVGAVILAVAILIASAFTPGYDHRYDTISRLASPGQPWAWLVRSGLVVFGAATLSAAITPPRSGANHPRAIRRLIALAGAAAIVAGIAPKDPPDVPATAISQLHVAAAVIGVAAIFTGMVLTAATGPQRTDRPWSAAAAAVVVIAGAAFPFAWGTAVYGILQRVILLTTLAWLVRAAYRLDRPKA
ncbi:MAG: DUF998 domain-containing protein [Acidimicrobiia bacterium]|nr:DUF998 domain-containing protein [Acidimicrobiia bacterium]